MATARDRRVPHLNLTLDMPSCSSRRYPTSLALAPIAAPKPSTSVVSTSVARRHGEFRISDLERLAILGRGNGGTVYKVSHRRTSALYALKVLHGGGGAAGPAAAAVLTEADIACRVGVDSPYIVHCHSVFLPGTAASDSGDDVSLLLELMDGGSLDSLVAAGHGSGSGLPEAAVAEVAAQALSGLAYLRSRRVVHRDVKPANLLVSRAGQVKLADFGIASVVSGDGEQHRAAYEGTAAYMSPERFDTERLQDGGGGRHADDPYAADVWSLGVTVMELVMGRHPLLPSSGAGGGRNRKTPPMSWPALMWAICFGEPPALPDGVAASPELRGFVAACLQKDHRKRATAWSFSRTLSSPGGTWPRRGVLSARSFSTGAHNNERRRKNSWAVRV